MKRPALVFMLTLLVMALPLLAQKPPCPAVNPAKCPDTKTLISQLKTGDPCAKYSSAVCLADSPVRKAVAPLMKTLNDPNPQVRAQAALALGESGHTSAIRLLLPMLKSDPDAGVRTAVAKALGMYNENKTGPALIAALGSDSSDDVRAQAAVSLGEMQYDPSAQPLMLALKDKDPEVRQAAVNGLAEFRNGSSARTLASILLLDPQEKIRAEAARSLGRCCVVGEPAVQYSAGIDDFAFYDPAFDPFYDPFPYEEVTIRLGKSRTSLQLDSEAALEYAVNNDKSSLVRAAAIAALGESYDKDLAPALAQLLKTDKDPLIRGRAAAALGNIRATDYETELTAALQDPAEEVRTEAEIALEMLEEQN